MLQNGEKVSSLKPLPLYREYDYIPENVDTLYITEGEKDADVLHSHRLHAVSPLFNGKPGADAVTSAINRLKPSTVIVCQDKDKAGIKKAELVVDAIKAANHPTNYAIWIHPTAEEDSAADIDDYLREQPLETFLLSLAELRKTPSHSQKQTTLVKQGEAIKHTPEPVQPEVDSEELIETLEDALIDETVAEQLISGEFSEIHHTIRFDGNTNKAYTYTDGIWRHSESEYTSRIRDFTHGFADQLVKHVMQMTTDPKVIKKLKSVHKRKKSATFHRNVARVTKTRRELSIFEEEFDSLPNRLAFKNGIVEITKDPMSVAEPTPIQPADYITKHIEHNYNPKAEAPQFQKFLDDITCNNHNLKEFLQIAVGISLIQGNPEKAIFLLHGEGGNNGKSKFLEILSRAFGFHYTGTIDRTAFEQSHIKQAHTNNAVHAEFEKRLVSVHEIGDKISIDEEKLKQVSGNDAVSVKALYKNTVTAGTPHFTLWLTSNNIPSLSPTSALWRRLIIVPFDAVFTKEQEDTGIAERILSTEAEGIIAWAMMGLGLYLSAKGSKHFPFDLRTMCKEVEEKTKRHQYEVNIYLDFISSELEIIERGLDPEGMRMFDLYKIFADWKKKHRHLYMNVKAPRDEFYAYFRDQFTVGDNGKGTSMVYGLRARPQFPHMH